MNSFHKWSVFIENLLCTRYSLYLILSTTLIFTAILWSNRAHPHFTNEETEAQEREVTCPSVLSVRDRVSTQTQPCVTSSCPLCCHVVSFETNSIISNFVLLWVLYLSLKIILYLFFTMLMYTVVFSLRFWSDPVAILLNIVILASSYYRQKQKWWIP